MSLSVGDGKRDGLTLSGAERECSLAAECCGLARSVPRFLLYNLGTMSITNKINIKNIDIANITDTLP